MKILQIISSFPPAYSYGGAARVAYAISKELVRKGHEVTVYTTDAYDEKSRLKYKENPELIDGIKVYRFRNISNTLSKKNYAIAPYMIISLKNHIEEFDIVHIHEYRSFQAIFAEYFSRKCNVPYILQAHGSVLPFFEKLRLKKIFDFVIGRNILQNASKLVAVSSVEVNQYIQMRIPYNKIALIPNGIDINNFSELPEYGIFRKKYSLKNKKIILFLGRLHEIKGIDFLIQSYAELTKEIDNTILVLAGPDENYRIKVEKLICKFSLEDKIIFTGYIDGEDKLAAYIDSDILVYPSAIEIFGLVPFEAIMCGTPVIVSDGCGCGDLIKKAMCGYTVKYGDTYNLKELMKLVIENPNKSKEPVENGITYINDNLTYENIVCKLVDNYEYCIHNI